MTDIGDDIFNRMRGIKKPTSRKSSSGSESSDEKEARQARKYGMDYYKILGIDKDAPLKEVKKRYKHLLAKFHPDRSVGFGAKEIKEKKAMYDLVREAGEILTDPDKRRQYDKKKELDFSTDFVSQKDSFKDFIKLQESEMTEEKKKMAELEFSKAFEDMNKKRGYDPEAAKIKLSTKDTDRRLEDLTASRDIEFVEITKPNPFKNRDFNAKEFNEIFEKEKKKQERKTRKLKEKGQIVSYDEEFTAFNDMGATEFVDPTADYGDIYGDDKFNGTTQFSRMTTKSPDLDDVSISSASDDSDIDVSYYDGHNKNRADLDDRLDALMRDRDIDTKYYDKMPISDFKSVLDDKKFGISSQFGTMLGKDFSGKSSGLEVGPVTDESVAAYKLMLQYEKESKTRKDKKDKSEKRR